MSEFEYTGICPECGEHTGFWGGATKAECENCKAWVLTQDIGKKVITNMV